MMTVTYRNCGSSDCYPSDSAVVYWPRSGARAIKVSFCQTFVKLALLFCTDSDLVSAQNRDRLKNKMFVFLKSLWVYHFTENFLLGKLTSPGNSRKIWHWCESCKILVIFFVKRWFLASSEIWTIAAKRSRHAMDYLIENHRQTTIATQNLTAVRDEYIGHYAMFIVS